MPALLTRASTLQCPHGGAVTAVPGATQAKADDYLLRATDTFTIAGCPFTTASPQPCLTVQWVSSSLRVRHGGDFVLTEACVGLCVGPAPQGVVVVTANQGQVGGL